MINHIVQVSLSQTGVLMDSYLEAIKQATNNSQFPELGDTWRNYHLNSVLSDSDYSDLTDTNEQL